MPLPEKDYYSLAEIAERWGTPVSSLRYYAESGYFPVKVWINEEVVKILRPTKIEDGRVIPVPSGFTDYKDYAVLSPEDVRRVFRGDPVTIQCFKMRTCDDLFELYNTRNRYTFTVDDLVVSRRERDRFEQLYKLDCFRTDNDRGPILPVNTPHVGRPSYMPKVVEHFDHRRNMNLVLSSLQQEGSHLENWARSNVHPTKYPRAGSIMNEIRSSYRQYKAARNSVSMSLSQQSA